VAKTKMPGTLRISGRDYDLAAEGKSCLNVETMGMHYPWDNRIILNDSTAPGQIRSTSLHEVLHACDNDAGTGLDEQAVTSLSSLLFAALRDNPQWVKWMMGW